MKRFIPYVFALMMGIMLWALLTPYARAHRQDQRLIGGEMLMPVVCVAATAIVRNRKKIAAELRSMNEKEDDDE